MRRAPDGEHHQRRRFGHGRRGDDAEPRHGGPGRGEEEMPFGDHPRGGRRHWQRPGRGRHGGHGHDRDHAAGRDARPEDWGRRPRDGGPGRRGAPRHAAAADVGAAGAAGGDARRAREDQLAYDITRAARNLGMDLSDFEEALPGLPTVSRGDILKSRCDAIVVPTNSALRVRFGLGMKVAQKLGERYERVLVGLREAHPRLAIGSTLYVDMDGIEHGPVDAARAAPWQVILAHAPPRFRHGTPASIARAVGSCVDEALDTCRERHTESVALPLLGLVAGQKDSGLARSSHLVVATMLLSCVRHASAVAAVPDDGGHRPINVHIISYTAEHHELLTSLLAVLRERRWAAAVPEPAAAPAAAVAAPVAHVAPALAEEPLVDVVDEFAHERHGVFSLHELERELGRRDPWADVADVEPAPPEVAPVVERAAAPPAPAPRAFPVEAPDIAPRDAKSESEECVVCFENARDSVFVHAGTCHRCCCMACAKAVLADGGNCPMCRAPVDMVLACFDS